MEIIKTKNGAIRFKEKVYLGDGSTQTKTFLRKTDAMKWKQDIESLKRRDPLSLVQTDSKLSVADLFQKWMTAKIYFKRDERTVYQYERFYKAHLENKFSDVLIINFTPNYCDQLISDLLNRGMKEKSVNNVLAFIKQIFKYAFDEELIKSNPIKKVRPISEPQRDFQFLHKEEVSTLLRSNRFNPIYPILVIAVNTGMRLGEIFGLCWDCVSFETEQILVKRTLSRKGLKEKTKTKLIRAIPMNDAILDLMKTLIKNQKSAKYVFADSKGDCLKPDHYSSREFKDALDQAGIKRIRFHDLRHTYASNYMMNGGHKYDLQKIMGHTKSETTDIYAHLSPNHLKSAVRVVNFTSDEAEVNNDSPCLALEVKTS